MREHDTKPKAGPVAKLAAALLLIGLATLVAWLVRAGMKVGVNQGYSPDQPIAFSHKIHVGENKIDCRYCHFGAEQGRHAGIPPANVCLNCHNKIKKDSPEIQKIAKAVAENKPIEWVKVHNLPDFVYFNHSQHVNAGVDCRSCHGPVETMGRMRQDQPLTMGWCIDCHRKQGIAPPPGHEKAAAAEFLSEKMPKAFVGGMDCAKCHY